MARPHLIIFDCDGVLVDSEPLANAVMKKYLTELGLPISLERTMERFVGLSLATMRKMILSEDALDLPDDFEEEVLRRDQLAFTTDLKAISGVSATLEALTLPKCVASSGGHEKIRTSLTLTGLLPYFDGKIYSAADVANGKPAPDLFLHAAHNMNTNPQDSLVIEDSLAGVQAGVAAGMRVFGFVGGGHIAEGHADRLLDAGALLVFEQMADLAGHIAKL